MYSALSNGFIVECKQIS